MSLVAFLGHQGEVKTRLKLRDDERKIRVATTVCFEMGSNWYRILRQW